MIRPIINPVFDPHFLGKGSEKVIVDWLWVFLDISCTHPFTKTDTNLVKCKTFRIVNY